MLKINFCSSCTLLQGSCLLTYVRCYFFHIVCYMTAIILLPHRFANLIIEFQTYYTCSNLHNYSGSSRTSACQAVCQNITMPLGSTRQCREVARCSICDKSLWIIFIFSRAPPWGETAETYKNVERASEW